MSRKRKKVLVAMSGGVDSSVAAAILKQQGYEVVGVTMQIWPKDAPPPEDDTGCCSLSAVEDARRVADILGIPHYVMNFRGEFEKRVIQNFVDEYMKGRTPNPCIVCNKEIKFSALLRKARALGIDLIATGHYAVIKYYSERKRYLLYKAKDATKDQTYVLYGLTQEQMKCTLFPLGTYTKVEVRRIAEELNLPVAEKAESQEICFVTDNDYRRFIRERKGDHIKPGPFLDTKGNVIGQHKGIPYYTIGQRRGLGIALGYPAYVVGIDRGKNAVIVGTKEELYDKELVVEGNNFIPFDSLEGTIRVSVKVRYKAKEAPAVIQPLQKGGKRVKVVFDKPQRAITPGQAAVYYQGDMVVGGGTIDDK